MDQRPNIAKVILTIIAASGIISLAAVAPGMIMALDKLGILKRHYQYYTPHVINRLKEKGLITSIKKDGKTYLRITEKGKKELLKLQQRDINIKKPKKWDGKYRVVIFDIKEYKRSSRDQIRQWLTHLGFIRLQNSVWVHPYECDEIISLLKANYHIGKEIIYMTVYKIDNDKDLRKIFSLS